MANLHLDLQIERGENTEAFNALPLQLLSTATRTSGIFKNQYSRGLILVVTIANEAGTCSFTPTILGYDASGTAFTLATFTALTANGTAILALYPQVLTGFSGTEAKVAPLPREFSVRLTYAGVPANDKMDTKVDIMLVN